MHQLVTYKKNTHEESSHDPQRLKSRKAPGKSCCCLLARNFSILHAPLSPNGEVGGDAQDPQLQTFTQQKHCVTCCPHLTHMQTTNVTRKIIKRCRIQGWDDALMTTHMRLGTHGHAHNIHTSPKCRLHCLCLGPESLKIVGWVMARQNVCG